MADFNKAATAILNAVELMINKSIAKAQFDKTYSGVILSAVGQNKYTVSVNGEIKTVETFKSHYVQERVFILVPQNNWNLARIISIE